MTAPTINGTRYPQPISELLPKARTMLAELGEVPSRNKLMTEFRIGAPKATDLRNRLIGELSGQFGYTPPDGQGDGERQEDATPAPDLTGLSVAEMIPAAVEIADQRGEVPTANEYATTFGISPERAEALTNLVAIVHSRRAAGRVSTIDGDPADEPARDPWDYAEPIGPDPAPKPAETTERAETLRAAMIARGALLPPAGTSWTDPVAPAYAPPADPIPAAPVEITPPAPDGQVTAVGHPDTPTPRKPAKSAVVWPVVLLALPAFVAIWSGWVGLGGLTGFGVVHPLPGIWDSFSINSAITLPIGVETYGAYALYVWLSGRVPAPARRFAKWSALGSLAVGALGQIAYHLLEAAGVTSAPWWITTAVACLPVAVLGMGAALAHLVRTHD